ncbi:hypothetical protein FA13DRAFT_1713472 [Coprinellus micaceus]|uniref:Uncharacterized protein n=1 Tax=Coprinellus micaceus TaxID=71717 RepID=A0A4Y7SW23_COPMI|nr:hypothetical protein FA13DRAFT_1713472 [Coprinellus micaceus]
MPHQGIGHSSTARSGDSREALASPWTDLAAIASAVHGVPSRPYLTVGGLEMPTIRSQPSYQRPYCNKSVTQQSLGEPYAWTRLLWVPYPSSSPSELSTLWRQGQNGEMYFRQVCTAKCAGEESRLPRWRGLSLEETFGVSPGTTAMRAGLNGGDGRGSDFGPLNLYLCQGDLVAITRIQIGGELYGTSAVNMTVKIKTFRILYELNLRVVLRRYEWMDPFSCIDRARISLAALPTFDHQAHITHDLPRSPQSPSRHLAAHGTIRDDPPSLGSHTPPVIAVVLASSSLPFPPDERVHLLEVSIYETQHELASARALLCVFERETWQTRGARRPFHLPQRRRAVESTYRHRIFRTCPFNAIERLGRVRETWSHPVWCSVGTYGGGRLRLKGC